MARRFLELPGSLMAIKSGERLDEWCGIEPVGVAVERGFEADLPSGHRLPRRRARSKPGARIYAGGHEESHQAR